MIFPCWFLRGSLSGGFVRLLSVLLMCGFYGSFGLGRGFF